jgi:hypothetical protein
MDTKVAEKSSTPVLIGTSSSDTSPHPPTTSDFWRNHLYSETFFLLMHKQHNSNASGKGKMVGGRASMWGSGRSARELGPGLDVGERKEANGGLMVVGVTRHHRLDKQIGVTAAAPRPPARQRWCKRLAHTTRWCTVELTGLASLVVPIRYGTLNSTWRESKPRGKKTNKQKKQKKTTTKKRQKGKKKKLEKMKKEKRGKTRKKEKKKNLT